MNKEMINDILDKINAEYQKYRKEMLVNAPESIFNAAAEIAVMSEILPCLEDDESFLESQTEEWLQVFLNTENLIHEIEQTFTWSSDKYHSSLDRLADAIQDTGDELLKKTKGV